MKEGPVLVRNHEDTSVMGKISDELAVIPINDGVVFPYMLVPLILRDDNLIRLIDEALDGNKIVGAFTQIDSEMDMPGPGDLYTTGCAMVLQKMARFPDGHVRIIGQGLSRIEIGCFTDDEPFMRAKIKLLVEPPADSDEGLALVRNVSGAFAQLVGKSEFYPDDLLNVIPGIEGPGRLADLLASNINMDISSRQKALEMIDPIERLEFVYQNINNELKIATIGERIKDDVHREMDREQKEYYLRQQIRAIQKELGDTDLTGELDELRDSIDIKVMPEHVREMAIREWNRLSRMSSSSSEYNVTRTYLDCVLDLPWEDLRHDILDIAEAKKILDRDHYDLDTVKERLLEFLAVRKLNEGSKGTIICLTGPPGVGKTSLGRSIASAMGRDFVRISLGGIRDEAEIRGHRRTYIGAMPGKILQGIRTAGTRNPVFMLDEIDKLGNDHRGDPSSALLEVLDSQQNSTFLDNYINMPFDLSGVMFITTANVKESIPVPLLDRMEIIDIPGYITSEKVKIARDFLIPRQLDENGIKAGKIEITDEALYEIIEKYTREAGVRNLERKIGSIARKIARKLVEGKRGPYRITPRNIKNYLGAKDFHRQEMLSAPEAGVATGMAKTATGGVILFIEALAIKGSGKVKLTGQLGDVMKESAETAMSFVRAHISDSGNNEKFFEKHDIHLHIPAGAVPKDGPSAGIAIAAALTSLATGRKVRNDTAVTGEITLTGKVLPVGGIKDKVIAAHRAGILNVILPAQNRNALDEIPGEVLNDVEFVFVDRVEDVLERALIPGDGKVVDRKGRGRQRNNG